jgi:Ca2+-transporting ATPase
MANWYQQSAEEVVAALSTNAGRGLSADEATRRLEQYGPNELIERGTKSPWRILWEQFTSSLVVVLIVAAVVSALLGDLEDAIAILAIVILNAVLGFRQEYRAERAMAALKRLAVPVVRVRRGGSVREISARDLVPGDVILLETGNLAPADARLLSAANLRVQEAALTGESEPVEKSAEAIFQDELAVGDRRNMVFMGTVITYGHGEAVITETGMQTELGRIADLLQTFEQEATPLQRRLDQLGRNLAFVALGIVLLIFGLGLWRGEELEAMFLTAVSMAVAAVPEGLPAVVTIALALGAQRMLKRHALIRKLPAVEALGSVTTICSDKTGTLTENRMTVTVLDVAGERLNLIERLQQVQGGALSVLDSAPEEAKPALSLLLIGGALCNDVVLEEDDSQPGVYRIVGDPTEGALAVAAARSGLRKPDLDQRLPRVAEAPFDSVRKRMTTVHRFGNGHLPQIPTLEPVWTQLALAQTGRPVYLAFAKGAMDSLMAISTDVWLNNRREPLTEEHRQQIVESHNQLAAQGMRVLGVAFRPLDAPPSTGDSDQIETDLTFVGLIAMIDPPRAEVKDAVATCKSAGIRPMMITGDHPLTARHIGEQLGIAADGGLLTGQELDKLTESELDEVVKTVSIYARVSPEHKLNIVEALQRQGQLVAMTGDGVNDAPALKRADIGVAMGITGTDVAKEAAEMVLQDDNFATIVAAVEEGRTIYDNIRKFIRYLLSCNSGEIWVMLLAPFLGMPLPLLPLQILWMNLVTDGLPALALGIEPAERNVMQRLPYSPKENIFSRGMGRDIIWVGLLLGIAPLAMGYWYWQAGDPAWQTMVFTTLVFSQLMLALAVRSERESLFTIGLRSNLAMVGAVIATLLLQFVVIYVPFAQRMFETVPLTLQEMLIALTLGTLPFWGVEFEKWVVRRS